MRPFRTVSVAAMLALAWTGPLLAAEPPSPDESVEKQRHAMDLAIEATQMLMRALQFMIEALPQYGPPHINENGDIVIPRIHEKPQPEPAEKSKPAKPGTPL